MKVISINITLLISLLFVHLHDIIPHGYHLPIDPIEYNKGNIQTFENSEHQHVHLHYGISLIFYIAKKFDYNTTKIINKEDVGLIKDKLIFSPTNNIFLIEFSSIKVKEYELLLIHNLRAPPFIS